MGGYASRKIKKTNHTSSGRELKALYNVFPGFVCILDEKGIVTDANSRTLEYFGYEKEEVMGRPCFDFIADSHKKSAMDAFKEMMRTGIGPRVDLVLLKKDGTRFFGVCRGVEIVRSQYLITIDDVSILYRALEEARENRTSIQVQYDELKRANQLLEEAKLRYQNLYESLPDLLRTIDLDNSIVDCNKIYAQKLGYSKEEVIGKSVFEHTAKKSYDAMKDSIKEWKRTGKIANREIWMKTKGRTEFPALLSGTNLYDSSGNVIGRTVSLRDITTIYESRRDLEERDRQLKHRYRELREAHLLLVETEEKYQSLYDYSPLMYRTVDILGIIRDCNKSYAKSLGYSKEEIIGKSIFDHVAGNSLDDLLTTFHTWRSHGRVEEKIIWLKRKDGTIFPTMLSASSVYNKKGEMLGSNTVIRDVSETFSARKQIEEERMKRMSAIGELSARIAHDLRNPMSTIKNAIALIKFQIQEIDANTLTKFELIDAAITRMTHQIDEVLDYVSPKPLTLVHIQISQVLENSINGMIIPATIQIFLPKNSFEILCDPYKMEVVLVNMITNAIQAMEGKGSITIDVSEDSKAVMMSVADTGPGIPAEELPKIFEPLFTTRMVGTGLGLTSCKSIVEKHGGTINVKTEIGNGTTFTIILPKKQEINVM